MGGWVANKLVEVVIPISIDGGISSGNLNSLQH